MKRKGKHIIVLGVSLLCLLSCVLPVAGIAMGEEAPVAESTLEKVLKDPDRTDLLSEAQEEACAETVTFIGNNLEMMKEQYELEFDSTFSATGIEDWFPVYVLGEEDFAAYIDFNGNNGYMVVSPDFELFALEAEGDLDYLKGKDFAYYSKTGGFVFFDEAGNALVPYEEEEVEETEEEVSAAPYDGQVSGEDGEDGFIYDLDAYVKDRYPNYTDPMDDETNTDITYYSIPNYEHVAQFDTSIYTHMYVDEEGFFHTDFEGNCGISALYSVFNSWKNQGFAPTFPSSSEVVKYDAATMEPNHTYTLSQGWKVNSGAPYSAFAKRINGYRVIDNVPELYVTIRQNMYDGRADYEPSAAGLNFYELTSIMYATMTDYRIPANITNFGDDFDVMKLFFNSHGAAQILWIENSSSYHNHTVACIGFKEYTYTSGWWIFQRTNSAYFLEIDDGHSYVTYNRGGTIYYDPNGVSGSVEKLLLWDTMNN